MKSAGSLKEQSYALATQKSGDSQAAIALAILYLAETISQKS